MYGFFGTLNLQFVKFKKCIADTKIPTAATYVRKLTQILEVRLIVK